MNTRPLSLSGTVALTDTGFSDNTMPRNKNMEAHKLSSVRGENVEEHPLITSNTATGDDCIHDIENPHVLLLTSLRKKLEKWPPLSSDHSIYRVPKQLLSKNECAYVPKVVSIGPLHHGRTELEAMEEYKQRFLAEFLNRAQFSLEDYVVFVKERERKLRSCYADTIELTSDELVEIVMVDAAFVILLLVKHAEDEDQECCRIFTRPYHLFNIMEDMLLLENQLPWFILEDLYNYAKIEIQISSSSSSEDEKEAKGVGDDDDVFSFMRVACDFINFRGDLGAKEYHLKKIQNHKMLHFLDCLRECHLSSKGDSPVRSMIENSCIPTVRELHQAGVKFVKSQSMHLLDIEFKNGVLSIPHMFMGDSTETTYRNILAFEQCHYTDEFRFTDYFAFMDQLINSPEDIDMLVKSGIIENTLGESVQAAGVYNNIAQGLSMDDESYYGHVCDQLRDYYETPWHKWKATLRQDYFNNPWAGISVIAAVILLVLTVIQTVFSILSY